MNKLFLLPFSLFFTTTLFAERGTVMLSCDSTDATIYVDNQRKTRLKKGVTSFQVEEGKHMIKVIEHINRECQRYVEKEICVSAKKLVNIRMKWEDNVEPTRSDRKELNLKDIPKNKRFKRTRCHVVKDSELHLVWQDNEVYNRIRNLNSAKKYCQELELSVFNDWRLPTYRELLSIVDYDRYNASIVPMFQHNFSSKYWTSSQDISAPNYTWFVDFFHGKTGSSKKSEKYYTRCVRDN